MDAIQTHYLNAKRLDDEAIKALTAAIIPTLGTGMHARRSIQRIVRNHFLPVDKKVTDRSLMTGTGWTLEKLHDYKRKVREFLCEIRQSLPSDMQTAMQYKTCIKCNQDLPISNFYKDISTKDGLLCYCKECHKNACIVRSLKNDDKLIAITPLVEL